MYLELLGCCFQLLPIGMFVKVELRRQVVSEALEPSAEPLADIARSDTMLRGLNRSDLLHQDGQQVQFSCRMIRIRNRWLVHAESKGYSALVFGLCCLMNCPELLFGLRVVQYCLDWSTMGLRMRFVSLAAGSDGSEYRSPAPTPGLWRKCISRYLRDGSANRSGAT